MTCRNVLVGLSMGSTLTLGCAYSALQMGESSAGGATVSGSSAATGTTATGGAAGGDSAAGGTSYSAGGNIPGGTSSTGGAAASGGSPATGGGPGTGGTPTGGAVSIGGAVNTGGALATGGVASTGGTFFTGGAVATGGTTSAVGTQGGTMSTGGQLSTGGTPNSSCGTPTTPKASCQNLTTQCQGESCCTSITIQAGSFQMGRSTDTTASDYSVNGWSDEIPEHTTTVPAYALDKYEVTVGRFRQFVMAYDQWHGTCGNPKLGDGAIPNVVNTGWGQSWNLNNNELLANTNALKPYLVDYCESPTYSVTDTTHDDYPINCVDWYEAFAFCLWDGGWLPTEAQWEYAAAGGGDAQGNRLYPWGSTAPNHQLANYYEASCATCPNSPYMPVGSTPDGNARWGHADMAGSVWEWVFDWYSSGYYGPTMNPTACSNCANSTQPADIVRSDRGGDWESIYSDASHFLRSAARDGSRPDLHYKGLGFRCARPAQ